MQTTRRRFIKVIGTAIAAGSVISAAGCASYVVQAIIEEDKIRIARADVVARPFVVVQAASLPFPIYVAADESGSYQALWLRCTHRGCEVQPGEDVLICPCHGSEYHRDGTVAQGPAENPLQKFKVTTDENHISIYVR